MLPPVRRQEYGCWHLVGTHCIIQNPGRGHIYTELTSFLLFVQFSPYNLRLMHRLSVLTPCQVRRWKCAYKMLLKSNTKTESIWLFANVLLLCWHSLVTRSLIKSVNHIFYIRNLDSFHMWTSYLLVFMLLYRVIFVRVCVCVCVCVCLREIIFYKIKVFALH